MQAEFKHNLTPIGRIESIYPEKFGIPRQSGIVASQGCVVLVSPYDDANATRGLEEFSHMWILWQVSENIDDNGNWDWHPTVRPPVLGGNTRKGVFATRSPLHPNGIGLSCVKITGIEPGRIYIEGADIMDGTPVIDIKPYVSYSDSVSDARSSFATEHRDKCLEVRLENGLDVPALPVSVSDYEIITQIIAHDPRPHYHSVPERVYGMCVKNYNVKFRVEGTTAIITEITR